MLSVPGAGVLAGVMAQRCARRDVRAMSSVRAHTANFFSAFLSIR